MMTNTLFVPLFQDFSSLASFTLLRKLFGAFSLTDLCKNIPGKSFENHSQNVPLPTPELHNGAIFQPAIPKT